MSLFNRHWLWAYGDLARLILNTRGPVGVAKSAKLIGSSQNSMLIS